LDIFLVRRVENRRVSEFVESGVTVRHRLY